MHDAAYFQDKSHMLLTGITGSRTQYGGKTALATWWCDEPGRAFDLEIFANVKQDDVGAVLEDFTEVSSVDGVASAMADGRRRIILTPTDPDWAAVSRRLEAFVRELPSDMTKLVVLDEVPELDEEAVLSFVRVHGNGANCKTLAIAQSPTDVSNSVVKQTTPVWVGLTTGSYAAWFRSHNLEQHFAHVQQNHEPYHWTVMTGPADEDRDHYQPVPERYGEV
jgi:hypothetical protein